MGGVSGRVRSCQTIDSTFRLPSGILREMERDEGEEGEEGEKEGKKKGEGERCEREGGEVGGESLEIELAAAPETVRVSLRMGMDPPAIRWEGRSDPTFSWTGGGRRKRLDAHSSSSRRWPRLCS